MEAAEILAAKDPFTAEGYYPHTEIYELAEANEENNYLLRWWRSYLYKQKAQLWKSSFRFCAFYLLYYNFKYTERLAHRYLTTIQNSAPKTKS